MNEEIEEACAMLVECIDMRKKWLFQVLGCVSGLVRVETVGAVYRMLSKLKSPLSHTRKAKDGYGRWRGLEGRLSA